MIEDELGFKYKNIKNNELIAVDDVEVECVECLGHSWDHFAFLMSEEQTLFCGDIILGEGSAVIDDLE